MIHKVYTVARAASLLFIFLFSTVPLSAQEQAVAMITSATGKAIVQGAAGKINDASVGTEVKSGELLIVHSGTASLVFMAGEFLELQAGEQLTLGASLAASKLTDAGGTRGVNKDEAVTVAANGLTRQQGKDALSQLAIASGIRGDAMPIAVAPRLVISDPNPLFCWFDTDEAAKGGKRVYTIVIRDAENALIAQKDVEGQIYAMNMMRADKLGISLKPGAEKRYTWAVYAEGKVPALLPDFDAMFVFADKESLEKATAKRDELQELLASKRIDEQSFNTLLSLYFTDERERLFSDAIAHLHWLAGTTGGVRFAKEQYARILPRFGNQVSVVASILAGQ